LATETATAGNGTPPSMAATARRTTYTEVTEHSGVKSGIASEEKDIGESSKNSVISNVESSLRIA
jgi:hypothetical protein